MALHIDWTIKVSDILTSVTLAVSVIALLLSLAKDRDTKVTEQANRVRTAAALAITKLDRWQALQLSLYQEMQPTFVELSELLAERFEVQYVRDQLWKQVNVVRTGIAQKVLDEQLGMAYSDLLSHFPAARGMFTEAFSKLSAIESEVTQNYLGASEQAILGLEGQRKVYTTPTLGNALRQAATSHSNEFRGKSEAVIAPVRDYLFRVISMPDSKIIGVSKSGDR